MQLPSFEKSYMPTLVNGSDVNMADAKMVEKADVATIVANKDTWPVTVQKVDCHPEDENVGNQGRTHQNEIKVETARGGFDPAPRAEKGLQRPRKQLRRPGGGRPREELNTTTSTNKPEKNSTLGGVTVEGTEPEHASLFTVRGRICACREDSFDSSVELLVDCGATSDFMSMQTAKRARLPLYKLRNPGHVLTAGGVQVEVRYYTRAYVRVGELVFRHHFKVLEILPDVVLGLPWLRSYNPTVNPKERYADIQHGSILYRLSFGESRHSTQLQFQAAPKLDLLSILSSSSSKASRVGNPAPHANEHPDLHSSTHVQRGTDMYDESETKDGITDEECSDMKIEYISLPKLKREIRRSDLTGDQVFLCCMPRPAVPVDEMYKMQASDGNDDGLNPVRRKLPNRLHKWVDLYDREKAEYGDLPPHRPGRDHRIRLDSEDNPPWVHPYKMDPSQLDELRRQLDKLPRSGRIRPPSSPYGAGCLLVKKANGKWRMCVDYRALNTRTVRDRYPLPSIQSILSTLGRSTVFTKIELVSGFHQIRIQDEDIEKTAFNTQFGAFEWVVMPFGLCNAPSTFQRVVNDVLRDHFGIFVWVYIDDILVFSKDADEHQRHLDLVHELLRKHQLFPCIDKSTFFQSRVPFCGYIIDQDGVHMDPEKIKVIRGWPPPTTVHEVRQFIRLCGFYQQFVEGFQAVAAPLTAMFKADFEWEWTAAHQASFDKLKQAMISATHLSAIDPRQPYHLYTDASKDCSGATLAQRCAHGKYKGHLRPVAFMSRKMQPAETRYPIREQELLAIVLALKQWFHLLRGPQQVHVHTDHESLRYLKTCPRPLTARQARWSQFLEEYNLTLGYVPGLENPAADACSRLTSRQLIDIENATRTRAFAIPLVEDWASPEGEPVDEFLHVLEDSFSHDEVWPQPYDHLCV